jgi:heavy metal sensor kinase
MSSRKRLSLRNTLAFRLTIWYAGIFTLSACIAFLLFYMLVTSFIRDRTDQELLGQVRRFATVLVSAGVQEATQAMAVEAQAAGVRKVFFRLLYPSGVAFSSSNMAHWQDIGIDGNAIKQVLQGTSPVFETIAILNRKDEVRILYARLSPVIIVQVGQAMESYSRFLDAFKGIFIGTMVFLIVLATGVGWFMAKQAVSGVEAVTRTARMISGSSLEERVPVKARGDEIDQLAITFNQMLDRIQRLLTELKEMTDNIAHDLKSPIARVRGAAEVTLSTAKSLGEYEAMAASTIEECDRLLDMINAMLLISKTEAGVDKLSMEEIDLAPLARDACELFRPSAEDKEIALHCKAPEKMQLTGDSRMIQRMLANLLDNAIKYTPPGGRVDVSVSNQNPEQILISVADTGVGIASGDLPLVFERFYRGDQSRSESGIGLGLSLAKAIAHAHNGDITVTSAPGAGSTFTATLPVRPGSRSSLVTR